MVYYFIDQLNYWMLIVCIKIFIMLKHQLFDDSNNKERVPRVYKCPRIDKNDNKKQDLDQ